MEGVSLTLCEDAEHFMRGLWLSQSGLFPNTELKIVRLLTAGSQSAKRIHAAFWPAIPLLQSIPGFFISFSHLSFRTFLAPKTLEGLGDVGSYFPQPVAPPPDSLKPLGVALRLFDVLLPPLF